MSEWIKSFQEVFYRFDFCETKCFSPREKKSSFFPVKIKKLSRLVKACRFKQNDQSEWTYVVSSVSFRTWLCRVHLIKDHITLACQGFNTQIRFALYNHSSHLSYALSHARARAGLCVRVCLYSLFPCEGASDESTIRAGDGDDKTHFFSVST